MASLADSQAEVALEGVADEFREALRAEIEAAKRAASSSAVSLLNGRAIGQVGASYQYAFVVESPLSMPDGTPGDLHVPGQDPLEASIVSIDGMTITLGVNASLGAFVPRASLQSSFVHLLRKLVSRIEDRGDEPNRLGDAIINQRATVATPTADAVADLNVEQREAVQHALGSAVTFIWGPPGTGKTKTIGKIGELLARRDQSVLLVSHTNAAVDQALLRIAESLGDDLRDGSVLRLGEPKDLRLRERQRLQAETHVRERSEELTREADELRGRRRVSADRAREINGDLVLLEWVTEAQEDFAGWRGQAQGIARLEADCDGLRQRLAELRDQQAASSERRAAAQAAKRSEADLRRLSAEAAAQLEAVREAAAARSAAADAAQRAETTLAQLREMNALMRRWRGLPTPEEQEQSLEQLREQLERCQHALREAEDKHGALVRDKEAARSALADFETAHGAGPDQVLSECQAVADELVAVAGELKDGKRKLQARVGALEEVLARAWEALVSSGLLSGASTPTSVDDRLKHLEDVLEDARRRVAGLDASALRLELSDVNRQIAEIDRRIGEIEEALAQVEHQVVADATVVATTLTRAYLRESVQARRFDTVILDEASMAQIPALWLIADLADRAAVVVGDFLQLPPICHSDHPLAQRWLARDIFGVAGIAGATPPDGTPPMVVLRTQHRMHPQISRVVNDLVYDDLLRDAPGVGEGADLDGWFEHPLIAETPVLLVDTGSAHAWVTSVGGSSRLNFLSATVSAELASQMLAPNREELEDGSDRRVLIASPYRPHARLVELLLRDAGLEREVVAGTAHTFQGSEAPVVIVDLVNDEPHWRVRMFDPDADADTMRLLNVAITRARSRLVVVGDFDYILRQGKRAFTGRFVSYLVDHYRRVDAVEIVAAGLSARVAAAQLEAAGGPIEASEARTVATQDHFYRLLSGDLAAAKQRVVIYSAFMTANRIGWLEPQIRAAIERGVQVVVVTKTLDERGSQAEGYRHLEETLEAWGAVVIHKFHSHEKFVFVDDDIVWFGSLNPLSFSDTQEIMERRQSPEVFDDFVRTLRLEEMLGTHESGGGACPVCGGELVPAEGTDEPYYWRCLSADCGYTRNIGDAVPVDGVLPCRRCGAPVAFGMWGDQPVWRCSAPGSKHRQKLARSHLRLPRMLELIPARDRKRVASSFGLGEVADGIGRRPARADTETALTPSTRPEARPANGAGNGQLALDDALVAGSPTSPTLTNREIDVVGCMARHLSKRQIADALGLSPETVKTYIRDINRKLGTTSRQEAVAAARRQGWV